MTKDSRFQALENWLAGVAHARGAALTSPPTPASSDASFRRYFRAALDGRNYIIMDAPPEREGSEAFVRIASWLRSAGLNAPEVLEWDRQQGFLLLSDLGAMDYQRALTAENADMLYQDALDALTKMQVACARYVDRLPIYDEALLREEMALFSHWLAERMLGLPIPGFWEDATKALVDNALRQPRTFVHRDYHSRNLMLTQPNPGILDFQDAVAGPLTYDAVSLLRDCYVRWPSAQVSRWRDDYFQRLVKAGLQSPNDALDFMQAFDLMGVQRHLKAAGIFARLFLRDGKSRYLANIPNTLRYIVEIGSAYGETDRLAQWVETTVLPAWQAREDDAS